jgi:transcription-repair coupling factor (superfamily II helicase)
MDTKNPNLFRLKKWVEDGDTDLRVTGLSGAARVYFLAQFFSEIEKPCLVILPQAKDANRLYRELEFFLPQYFVDKDPGVRRLYDFPAYDISPLAGLSPHRDVVTRRLQSLYALTSQNDPIVITSVEAILFKILPQEALRKAILYMEAGDEVERDTLIQLIEENGYVRTSLVEERGDYSVRGGVIDIFPPLYSQPVRLEFWGDQIESIRHFDGLSQRSTDHLKEVHLLPASEILMGRENLRRARSMGRLPNQQRNAGCFPGQEAWLNHFYSHLDTLFDYFPRNGLTILIDSLRIEMEEDRFSEKVQKDREIYRQEAAERESPFPEIKGILLSRQTIGSLLEDFQRIEFSEVAIEKGEASQRSIHIRETLQLDDDLDIRLAGKGRVSMAPLAEKISKWLNLESRVVIVCRTEQQAHRLQEILHNYRVKVDQVGAMFP